MAVEDVEPMLDTSQAGAVSSLGAASAVVYDMDAQLSSLISQIDPHLLRHGVLGDVGQQLTDRKIARRLYRGVKTGQIGHHLHLERAVERQVLDAQFPQYGLTKVDVVASATPDSSNADRLVGRVEHLPDVRGVTQTPLGARTLLTTDVSGASNGPQAIGVVQDIRSLHMGYGVLVGGAGAFQLDHQHQLAGRLAPAIGLLAIVTAVMIALLTGSWALALAAPLLAALSQGAMLGALVWAFQQGHLRHILPMASTGDIIIYVPIVAFALAYALSLDYLVILLSRMREATRRGVDLNEAMTDSLTHTGQVVTAAAGLIALVFLGFATGSLLLVQQLGFALVVAVLLDATLVRCVLLPAVVALVAGRAVPGRSRRVPVAGSPLSTSRTAHGDSEPTKNESTLR